MEFSSFPCFHSSTVLHFWIKHRKKKQGQEIMSADPYAKLSYVLFCYKNWKHSSVYKKITHEVKISYISPYFCSGKGLRKMVWNTTNLSEFNY